jgi:hypothetical protein
MSTAIRVCCVTHMRQDSHSQAQCRATNLILDLKNYTCQALTIQLERHDIQHPSLPHDVAQTAAHLFKRASNTLLAPACSAAFGSGKVDAFRVLLLRDKFWVAGYGVCANVAAYALLGAHQCQQLFGDQKCPWRSIPYEMWHLARCVLSSLK